MREGGVGREVDESDRMCRGQKRGRARRRRNSVEEEVEKEDEGEDEEGRKEGVRVRVRLGVGGAIRNYCGTIDKRRLRGRTTEDFLRSSDLPSTASPPFRLLFSFSLSLSPPPSASPPLFSLPLGLPPRRHAVPPSVRPSVRRALPTKPSRLVNM